MTLYKVQIALKDDRIDLIGVLSIKKPVVIDDRLHVEGVDAITVVPINNVIYYTIKLMKEPIDDNKTA